tara:strand:- start:2013 stop:2126 length:114 start_codon:yes stop_codon:yes gene_type:complete
MFNNAFSFSDKAKWLSFLDVTVRNNHFNINSIYIFFI